jgi:hypothetical protein
VDVAEEQSPFLRSFQHTDINIEVPSGINGVPPRLFMVPGLYYCKIVTLIKEAFDSHISKQFHLTPFKLFWTWALPTGEDSECKHMYSELYNPDVFLVEHNRVQCVPTDDPSCKQEKVVTALMF